MQREKYSVLEYVYMELYEKLTRDLTAWKATDRQYSFACLCVYEMSVHAKWKNIL